MFAVWKWSYQTCYEILVNNWSTTAIQMTFLLQLIVLKANGQPALPSSSLRYSLILVLLSASCVPRQRWPCLSQGWGPAVVWTEEREGWKDGQRGGGWGEVRAQEERNAKRHKLSIQFSTWTPWKCTRHPSSMSTSATLLLLCKTVCTCVKTNKQIINK